jgi:hypothetical protein
MFGCLMQDNTSICIEIVRIHLRTNGSIEQKSSNNNNKKKEKRRQKKKKKGQCHFTGFCLVFFLKQKRKKQLVFEKLKSNTCGSTFTTWRKAID